MGMQGIGKTTLANLIFNHEVVVDHFPFVAQRWWIQSRRCTRISKLHAQKNILQWNLGRNKIQLNQVSEWTSWRRSVTCSWFQNVVHEYSNNSGRSSRVSGCIWKIMEIKPLILICFAWILEAYSPCTYPTGQKKKRKRSWKKNKKIWDVGVVSIQGLCAWSFWIFFYWMRLSFYDLSRVLTAVPLTRWNLKSSSLF